jgi:hypothetical protein
MILYWIINYLSSMKIKNKRLLYINLIVKWIHSCMFECVTCMHISICCIFFLHDLIWINGCSVPGRDAFDKIFKHRVRVERLRIVCGRWREEKKIDSTTLTKEKHHYHYIIVNRKIYKNKAFFLLSPFKLNEEWRVREVFLNMYPFLSSCFYWIFHIHSAWMNFELREYYKFQA